MLYSTAEIIDRGSSPPLRTVCKDDTSLGSRKEGTLRRFSFKSSLAFLIIATLLFLAVSPASARMASRSKLFIFVQGINSSLTAEQATARVGDGIDSYFFGEGRLGTYLQTQEFSNARYLEYSYGPLSSTATGQPKPYTCQDTYTYPLTTHILGLSQQVSSAVQNNPNTDVYIVAHSMGGIIAFGYLASLVEHVRGVVPLPRNGSMLKGVVTLDSPLGGITSDPEYNNLILLDSILCRNIKVLEAAAVNQMQVLFRTATSPLARGATASIVQTILNGDYLPNQQVADAARRANIAVLTIGNTNDLLWRPSVCNKPLKANMQDFSSTQWLQDEGNQSLVYSRVFTSGLLNCLAGVIEHGNHEDVFTIPAVGQAVAQIANESAPS